MRDDAAPGRYRPTRAPVRSLRDLQRRVEGCRACGLHADRARPVTSAGPDDADLMIVGAVPHRHEDLQGRPLAGARANVLDHALDAAGIARDEVHLATVVRCRPSDDRPPTRDEVEACLPHLEAQVALVAPRVVVALGAAVASVLLGRPVSLDRVAGYRLDLGRGMTLIPTHTPADVVRGDPQATAALGRDLRTAKAVLDGRLRTGAQTLADARSRMAATT